MLTAAHCVEKTKRKFVGPVSVGGVFASRKSRNSRVNYKVESIAIHPKRNLLEQSNDLAILQVKVPFNLSKNVQPIPIGNLSVDRIHENETVNVLLIQRNLSCLPSLFSCCFPDMAKLTQLVIKITNCIMFGLRLSHQSSVMKLSRGI